MFPHRTAGPPAGRRGKYAVLVLWLVLLSVAGPLAVKLGEAQDNSTLGALPAGVESSRAAQRVEAAFPDSRRQLAIAVYVRDGGLTAADRARADADRAAFAGYAEGGVVSPPVPSADGRALLFSLPVSVDEDRRAEVVSAMKERLAEDVPSGLRTALTGDAAAESDVFDAFGGMDGALLLATAVTVALLLLVTYRSPVLWLVPLIAVGVANQLAAGTVYLLARHAGLAVDFQSQTILTVLVFGVGVDYALLLIARYREELRRHADRHAAMATALRRSYSAICASAATVALGLLCLLAADLPATRGLGPVGAVGIVAALLAMTTLLPALLVLLGRWVFWPFVPRYAPGADADDRAADHGVWRRIAGPVGRRPRLVWVGTTAALLVLTLGIGNLSLGLPDDESFTTEVGSVTGQRLIADHYPGGSAAPVEVVAAADAADRVVAAVGRVPGVSDVNEPQRSADGRWVRVTTVLTDAPDSAAARDTVTRLRDAVHAVPGAEALVGGRTAMLIDERRTVDRDNRVVIPLVLAVVLVILVLLLRALVAPLLLMASVILTYAAAMGAAGLLLGALGHPHLFVGIPLQAFLFLVALGVDYTIFLMTRAREETALIGHRAGVLRALTVTGGVITSAGVVLAATFGALLVLPLVPSVQTGVIVGVGILLDTFLVRSLLIPALTLDLGVRTWWPGRLAHRPAGREQGAPLNASGRERAPV
ncbi:MMPL family transporter [Micromonospora sp. WMMD975]|uniref:MMPL family transporter n=1 Tax=Micromonospora sp. WMMD975 TaxID=3016087 RepID=UPI00249B49DA|nr:MMPL family transporter [Micromonospora sp. WMMD975]WFE31358.1 MMPL family transporter [Micromonospora sp. WMMD975]